MVLKDESLMMMRRRKNKTRKAFISFYDID